MDGIKKLAERLRQTQVEARPHKASHTLSLNHRTYRLLHAYCRRKELIIGDVVSDLMQILLDELTASGELTAEDQTLAEEADRIKEEREGKKTMKKVG